MPGKSERKPPGVQVTQCEAAASDRCNFHVEGKDAECGEWAVTALTVTDTDGHEALFKLCRRHLCRLSILLVEELE
jgi:hypothetical protein